MVHYVVAPVYYALGSVPVERNAVAVES